MACCTRLRIQIVTDERSKQIRIFAFNGYFLYNSIRIDQICSTIFFSIIISQKEANDNDIN